MKTSRFGSACHPGPLAGQDAQACAERVLTSPGLPIFPRVPRLWFTPYAWMYELSFDPNAMELDLHAHDVVVFELVLSGVYRERCGDVTRYEGPGNVVYTPVGIEHGCGSSDGPVHVFTVKMLAGSGAPWEGDLDLIGHGVAPLIRRLYAESRAPDVSSPLVIAPIAAELGAAGGVRRRPRAHADVSRVRDRLLDDTSRVPTLAELAEDVGLHPQHLARSFRALYGCTPGCYHRLLRLEEAARRLGHSREPIATIAHGLGFADQSHLGRLFKRTYGLSPMRFRRLVRG